MGRRTSAATLLAVAAVSLGCSGLMGPPPEAKPGHDRAMPELGAKDLSSLLEPARAELGVPALAFGVVRQGELVAAGAVGERVVDGGVPVTVHDQWHLGSNTKSITATVAASMVEQGTIRWETTVAEVFPGAEASWSEVSLADLLHHRGGVPDLGLSQTLGWRLQEASPRAIRRTWIDALLAQPPAEDRGRFRYSNAGYVLAGAMLEETADSDWEALVRERVFEPLGMERSGFGPPPLPHNPSGHAWLAEQWFPVGDSGWADNPEAIGPAGTVHAPLADWARYVDAHLAVLRGERGPFEGEAYRWLHEPPPLAEDQEYAYAAGWIVFEERDWAHGPAIGHNGSNGSWFAMMALAPARDLALLCVTNGLAGGAAEDLCLDLVIEVAEDESLVGADPEPELTEDLPDDAPPG